ncbi:MAG: heme exporter protein CcmD [Burkholderiaceae bacterium]|nr:heme exporter protein CcmD [Burkholderiaceae bacterium]
MIDWLRMGGYGFYVWSSYGMLAFAIVAELHALRRRRRTAQRRAAEMRAEQAAQATPQPMSPSIHLSGTRP